MEPNNPMYVYMTRDELVVLVDEYEDSFLKMRSSRRERIAMAALTGLLTYPHADCQPFASVLALQYADALIAALDEKTP